MTGKDAMKRASRTWLAGIAVLGVVLACAAAAGGAAAKAPAAPPADPVSPVRTPAPLAPPEVAPAMPATPETPAGTGETIRSSLGADGTIDLHAKNEDLANVLEMLSQTYHLNIVTSRAVKGRVTVDLYKANITQTLDAICRANGLKWSREDTSIYVFTPEEGRALRLDESRLVTEVFRLSYLTGDDAAKLLTPVLSSKATVAVSAPAEKGIATGMPTTSGNLFGLQDALVVRDFPENMEDVRRLLKRMDVPPKQVLVEATILQVKLEDDTSLGINFSTLAGINFKDLTGVTAPTSFPASNPTGLLTDSKATVPATAGSFLSASTQGFATPGTGLNIGIVTNNVSVFVHALETVTDTTILSNPKVLALNKQQSEVRVGQRLGYRTTTVTETTTVETIQFLETGTQLIFRPFISDDGYVRMQIRPKVSSGAVVAGLPQETTTEVTANIMVKDGNTIVIGGLFDETATINRSQVPGLGNLPGPLGWLFRNNADKSTRNEIVVLLTPHVIDNDEAANALGRQALEDSKRHCLGMRENFACFTRERIATGYLQEADRAWQRYEKDGRASDLNVALWNVQLALGVGPNNLKALKMKDKILTAKRGEAFEAPNWTVWDSIQDRLRDMDEAKVGTRKAVPAEEPLSPPAAPAKPGVRPLAPAKVSSVRRAAPSSDVGLKFNDAAGE
jgi:type IV pilus assembly protein PilQ